MSAFEVTDGHGRRFRVTGEKRAPKRGEWHYWSHHTLGTVIARTAKDSALDEACVILELIGQGGE